MENGEDNYSIRSNSYGSSDSSGDSTVTDVDGDSSNESLYKVTMEDGSRPVFIMGDEEGKLSSTCTQGVAKNIDGRKIVVGVCAMAKKTNSKPMKEILGRLTKFEHLQVIVFDEKMILTDPVEDWPLVDALISFFSNGFPLQKAIEYKNLRKPFVVNDLEAQYILFDRREVYKILVREGIAHPRYAIMTRDCDEKDQFDENEDAIEVNGVTFQRPFVEKPVCAEDHNIYIYFPVSAGGGCQRLFRKVGSRSSVYSTINRVRKTGSYVYEDFMPTDGTDVKVYTVGPDYAHAEARKSPALDGKVERDKDGKEIRYPVLLSASEKLTARKVCMAFKQNVCGFDLLRANGKSYVCDVNGFSFVKNSTKYYDDCANVLGTMIVRALAPQLHIPLVLGAAPEDIPVVHTTSGSMMELRCVVAVIRHGDRTPKQKMKMEVKHRKFFLLFEKYGGYKAGHLKLKKPKQLQEILDIARDLLNESDQDHNPEVQEKKAKLRQLKLVLEMYGHFSGINRKVQLKYQPRGAPKRSSSEEDERPREPSLVLIVKWGGELTPAGKFQAEDLGKAFRTLYPGGQGEFETPGLGFLRLHSTFRHDLKIYASDEGRVQMTAAAFTKGLLALEGELTPILVSMVKSANTNGLLDKEGETSKYQHVVKERLLEILNEDREFTEDDNDRLCPTSSRSLLNAMKFIQNPRRMCDRVFEMVKEITARIKMLKMELKSRDLKLYHGESWELLIRRWAKLEKDFKLKTGNYDISKIPDIYDCIKYDLQHNQKTLQYDRAEELFRCSKALADIVIPQEYGIKVEEKLHISQSICTPLMRKIHSDLLQVCQQNAEEESTRLNSKYSKGVSSPERFVRTRLYFTSESHIHSLLNMFRYGGLFDEMKDEQWKKATDFLSTTAELNYMTQINIMMFEDPSKEFSSPERFHIELHFSPGAYTSCDTDVVNPISSGYRTVFLSKEGLSQKKMTDAETSDTEDGKKGGKKEAKKEGLKLEETISEEGWSDEFEQSADEPPNSPIRSRFRVHKAAQNPFILIDKPSESQKPVFQKETGVNVNLTDFEDLRDREAALVDVEPETSETDGGTSPKIDVSEATLCPETMTDQDETFSHAIQKETKDYVPAGSSDEKLGPSLNQGQENIDEDLKGEELYQVKKDTEKILEAECVQTRNENGAEKFDLSKDAENTDDNEAGTLEKKRKKSSVSFDLDGLEDIKTEFDSATQNSEEKNTEQISTCKSKEKSKKIFAVERAEIEVEGCNNVPERRKIFTVGSPESKEGTVESSLVLDNEMNNLESESLKSKSSIPSPGLEVQGRNNIPQPKSPDPDIPEWDWGDSSQYKNDDTEENKSSSTSSSKPEIRGSLSLSSSVDREMSDSSDTKSSPRAVSKPLTIEVKSSRERKRTGSFDSLKTYEENRSRSLEEKADEGLALMEKHYLTIHLPINKDRHFHSFSSLLYLNPDAFRDGHLVPTQFLLGSYSAPDLSDWLDLETEAFDGFNMVPSLKPLETLHNNLTLKDMDGFLSRATTTKFFTPVSSPMYAATPLVSPRLPEVTRHKSGSGHSLASAQSLPSSSNSSAGPSSPTSVSTPVDFFSKLKMFILDSQKTEHDQYTDQETQVTNESDLPCAGSSAKLLNNQSYPPCSNSSTRHQNTQSLVTTTAFKHSATLLTDVETVNQTRQRKSPKEVVKGEGKNKVEGEPFLKEDEQKTLTSKSPEAFPYLKPQIEQSQLGTEDSAATPTSDLPHTVNDISAKGHAPKSPTSLIQRLPSKLTEVLKLDVGQETHKSAFKKVGQRFKTSHVPEDSLKTGSSGSASSASHVNETDVCKDRNMSNFRTTETLAETAGKANKLEEDLYRNMKYPDNAINKEVVKDFNIKEGSLEKEVDFSMAEREIANNFISVEVDGETRTDS